jgi:hypothetical protein
MGGMGSMKKLFRRLFPSKEMRAYHKMHRKHRRELMKLAKEDREYDWSYLHDIVMTKIRHMYEYYEAGNNVWQSEESLNKVLSTLKEVIDLDKKWDDAWEECVQSEEPDRLTKYYDTQDKIAQELYSKIGQNMFWWWD